MLRLCILLWWLFRGLTQSRRGMGIRAARTVKTQKLHDGALRRRNLGRRGLGGGGNMLQNGCCSAIVLGHRCIRCCLSSPGFIPANPARFDVLRFLGGLVAHQYRAARGGKLVVEEESSINV